MKRNKIEKESALGSIKQLLKKMIKFSKIILKAYVKNLVNIKEYVLSSIKFSNDKAKKNNKNYKKIEVVNKENIFNEKAEGSKKLNLKKSIKYKKINRLKHLRRSVKRLRVRKKLDKRIIKEDKKVC